MTYTEWLAASNISAAGNALGGLGVLQGAANSGLLSAQGGAAIGSQLRIRFPADFAQGLVAEAQKHAVSFKPEVPLTRYDGMTDAQVPVTQEWIDETQRVQSDLANRLSEANREIGKLTAMLTGSGIAPTEQPEPNASRIWEAIVAYSSR